MKNINILITQCEFSTTGTNTSTKPPADKNIVYVGNEYEEIDSLSRPCAVLNTFEEGHQVLGDERSALYKNLQLKNMMISRCPMV